MINKKVIKKRPTAQAKVDKSDKFLALKADDMVVAARMLEQTEDEDGLTEKQIEFCKQYLWDFNAGQAAQRAGYGNDTVSAMMKGRHLIKEEKIKNYIKKLQDNLHLVSGITKMRVLQEQAKIAFSTMASFHKSWMEKEDFDKLTPEQKACIQSIDTRVKSVRVGSSSKPRYEMKEFVKITLYDKGKALETINKMLGFDAPIKVESNVTGTLNITVSNPQQQNLLEEVKRRLEDIDNSPA